MAFLDKDNVCGRTLLRLVARGSTIIAEIQRMRQYIHVFAGTSAISSAHTKGEVKSNIVEQEIVAHTSYDAILFDFKYLKAPDKYEALISSSDKLLEMDEDFQENHLQLLERFYLLFVNIYTYSRALAKYIDDLEQGFYIQHSLVSTLFDADGKQLLAEALYLYGAMLFMLERLFPGQVRERIVVSCLRYKGEAALLHFEQVVTLCRASEKRNDLFTRFSINTDIVQMIVGRLQSDDLYKSTTVAFPSPEHRSTALANQASMLFTILYFLPEHLQSRKAMMREVVDKFFNDNWVITIYMGIWVDLDEEWCHQDLNLRNKDIAAYDAANSAMKDTFDLGHVENVAKAQGEMLLSCTVQIQRYLTKGILSDGFMLNNLAEVLNCLRNANCTLRWFFLQSKTKNKALQKLVCSSFNPADLIQLLLLVSQLEIHTKETLKRLLDNKRSTWIECRTQCASRMDELSLYFTGKVALTRIQRDDTLVDWFKKLKCEIESLEYASKNPTYVGRRVQKVIEALQNVEQYNEIDTNLQVKQFLNDSRNLLLKMVKVVALDDQLLSIMEIVADMSYAWEIIDDYQDLLHNKIRKDPQAVIPLRAMFLKLASILDIPLVRLSQIDSPDVILVASYYSNELMQYVRGVLEIIPKTVFRIIKQLLDLHGKSIMSLPQKLASAQLEEYAQTDQRYEIARMTYLVSVFTQGIVSMQNTRTILGILEVDPRKILHDGIRKEIVTQICMAMNEYIFFRSNKIAEIELRLKQLTQKLDSLRRSFEYIQDYVNIYGLKVWQQEYSRVIGYYVEQECSKYLKRKVVEERSAFQSSEIPIPKPRPGMANFMCRAEQMLLDLTIPGPTTYSLETSTWYAFGDEVLVGRRFWQILRSSIGITGFIGLDKLLSFRAASITHQAIKTYRRAYGINGPLFHQLHGELFPGSGLPKDGIKFYSSAIKQSNDSTAMMLPLLLQIGHIQLLLREIGSEIVPNKGESSVLSSLGNLNSSIVDDLCLTRDRAGLPLKLIELLDKTGHKSPFEKVYVTTNSCERMPELLFLVVASVLAKFQYDGNLSTLRRRSSNDPPLDGYPLAAGVYTLMKQFHPACTTIFFSYLGTFIRCHCHEFGLSKGIPKLVQNAVVFFQSVCAIGNQKPDLINEHLPFSINFEEIMN